LQSIKHESAARLLQSYGGDHATNDLQSQQRIGVSGVTHSRPRLATLKSRWLRLWITPRGGAGSKINLTDLEFMVIENTM